MGTLHDDDDVSLPSSAVTLPTSPLSMSMGGSTSINGQLPESDVLNDSEQTYRSVDDLPEAESDVAAEQSHEIGNHHQCTALQRGASYTWGRYLGAYRTHMICVGHYKKIKQTSSLF